MLYAHPIADAQRARPLFATDLHLAIEAALSGEAPAELYVDDRDTPYAGALLFPNQRHQLAGRPSSDFAAAFAALLYKRYRPAADAEPLACSVAYTSAAWEDHLSLLFADAQGVRAEREYYCLQLHAPVPRLLVPEGMFLRQIDAALVADTTLAHHAYLMDEIVSEAPSVAEFLSHKFGYCLQRGGELIGWCLSEYNHGECCELGIEVLPPFQRRGLGAAVAWATIAHAYTQGITTIGWHCWKTNVASSSLARKLGFEKVTGYPVWVCHFGGASNA
jgi:GNAT superfamily N-acetyltransferase